MRNSGTKRTCCACAVALLLTACASGSASRLDDNGSGVYVMSKRSGFIPASSRELRAQVERDALALCQTKSRALVVLDVRAVDPDEPDVASATLRFRCDPV